METVLQNQQARKDPVESLVVASDLAAREGCTRKAKYRAGAQEANCEGTALGMAARKGELKKGVC